MPQSVKAGIPVVGVVFLLLALIKLVSGDPWVVCAILGFLFGGFSIFSAVRSKGADA